MIMHWAFVLMVQAAEHRPLEQAIDRFCRGDEDARPEILKTCADAIRPLKKARGRSPFRIDALVYEIKRVAGGAASRRVLEALEEKQRVYLDEADFWHALETGAGDLPLAVDPALFAQPPNTKITLKREDGCLRREILEFVCRQARVDFGFFYGVIVVGYPERLWPEGPPLPVQPLGDKEARQATLLIDKLGSDRVEDRAEAASSIRALGAAVVPLLEKHFERADAETAARCRALAAQLKRTPARGAFHMPAADRQRLEGADAEVVKRLRAGPSTFRVSQLPMNECLTLMLDQLKISHAAGTACAGISVTFAGVNLSGWEMLSVLCHANDLDFIVRNGRVEVDARRAIERIVPPGR